MGARLASLRVERGGVCFMFSSRCVWDGRLFLPSHGMAGHGIRGVRCFRCRYDVMFLFFIFFAFLFRYSRLELFVFDGL